MVNLLSASAGSGKTHTLAVNYLKELSKVYPTTKRFKALESPLFSGFLILTFTKKAAMEMKERIIRFLMDVALSKDGSELLRKEINLDPEGAEHLLLHLFLHYTKLQVSTIDSFLYKLFLGFSYELKLPSQLKVQKELSEDLIEEALVSFYHRAKDNDELSGLLEKLINFILEEEEKNVLNMKRKFLRGMQNFINDAVRGTVTEEVRDQEVDVHLPTPYRRGSLYLSLFRQLKEDLEGVLLRRKTIYMGFWKEKLGDYLKSSEFLPWIYFKLGKVQCLMKDESQDTDVLHYQNLEPLLENLLAEGRPIYFSWDPKQSIYHWRGAEPEYLANWTKSKRNKGYPIKEIKLNTNYRSTQNLIEFNNRFFSELLDPNFKERLIDLLKSTIRINDKMRASASALESISNHFYKEWMDTFYEVFGNVQQEVGRDNKAEGEVVIYYLQEKEKKRQESTSLAEKVILEILQELKEKGCLKSTAILLREKEDLINLYSLLSTKDFKIASQAAATLENSPLVIGLLGYLKLLLDENDAIALVEVLVNLFPEKGRAVLEKYANYRLKIGDSTLALKDYLRNFEKDFYEKYLQEPIQYGKKMPVYDFLQYLWREFAFKEALSEEKSFLNHLLSLVLQKQREGYPLRKFIQIISEEIKSKSVTLPSSADISLLTIHSAKGLEFDNVITTLNYPNLSQLGKGPFTFTTKKGVFLGGKKELQGEEEWEAYLKRTGVNILEEINLLYVTFTRAKKRLFILVPCKVDNPKTKKMVGTTLIANLFLQVSEHLPLRNLSFVEVREGNH